MGGSIEEAADESAWDSWSEAIWDADVIVDAVLGTGLDRAPHGVAALAIDAMVEAREAGVPVIAVDLPSGLPSDTGAVDWPTVVASRTVALRRPQALSCARPRLRAGGRRRRGRHRHSPGVHRSRGGLPVSSSTTRTRRDAFPARAVSLHKGEAGRVLLVAGSVGKTGAACLAAEAALRAGAGLVTVATARSAQASVAAACREVMTEGLPETDRGRIAKEALPTAFELAAASDVVVIGPGLGTDESTRGFVREFLRACPVPLVVDADGLNGLAGSEGVATDPLAWKRASATIVTPHPGEAARLLGRRVAEVQARRLESARELGRLTGATVVLKGYRTVIVRPDGRAAVNPTGNPALATAGTGDVLAGIVGATAARCEPWLAACGGGIRPRSGRGSRGRRAGRDRASGRRSAGRPSRGHSLPRKQDALREVRTVDVAETEALAAELAASMRGGEVVLLRGELGSGKTAFVRGLARGLGVDPGEVASPTFVLLTSHPGRLTLYPRGPLPAERRRGRVGAGSRRAARPLGGARGGVGGETWRWTLEQRVERRAPARGWGRAPREHRGRWGVRRSLAVAAVIGAVGAAGCPSPGEKPVSSPIPGVARAQGNGRNVLLVTIDTLRADHVGAYGYGRKTTPNIDALAAKGAVFTEAYTYWPKTRGSFVAMLTGRRAAQTGYGKVRPSLLDFNPTIASVLQAAGYRTVALVDNPNVAAALGYSKGFDTYRETFEEKALVRRSSQDPGHQRRCCHLPARNAP